MCQDQSDYFLVTEAISFIIDFLAISIMEKELLNTLLL